MSGVYIKDLSEADVIGLKAVFRDKVVVVPDHGRLIDADELMSKGFGDEPYKASVKRVLLQATTIIPADKE